MTTILVMGVSGCGKSTVGRLLAERLEGCFIEGDELHPESNIARMSAGIPLTDEDRRPWLDRIACEAMNKGASGRPVVIACSALKAAYRDQLRGFLPDLVVVYLKGSPEQISRRLDTRSGHFMPPALLESQFADLEEPVKAFAVDVGLSPDRIVEEILPRIPEQT